MGGTDGALRLVERIYEAVSEPAAWHDFVAELSEALGGAAVQMSLGLPKAQSTPDVYWYGLDETYRPVFIKHVLDGLPWGSLSSARFSGRFVPGSEGLGSDSTERTAFYREFMEPQGLAPESPLCHLIRTHQGQPMAGVVVYRRADSRPFGPDDLALLDSLVPHLARAYAIHAKLADARHECSALTEVIDRLPVGVILMDAEGRAVILNRSAEQIIGLGDGFRLERGRPHLDDPRENRALQSLIVEMAGAGRRSEAPPGGVLCVTRPSGGRGFPIWVGSLLASAPENRTDEAKAILFIANPGGGQISTTEVLESLYQLTHAEAELVRLLAEGFSLDQVAESRGVTMNTVRSQLKQVFCKTDTSRQGELVHLVLTGVASLRTQG